MGVISLTDLQRDATVLTLTCLACYMIGGAVLAYASFKLALWPNPDISRYFDLLLCAGGAIMPLSAHFGHRAARSRHMARGLLFCQSHMLTNGALILLMARPATDPFASCSVRRPLLTLQVNPGSLSSLR